MRELRMWTDGVDFVIAESAEEAIKIVCEHHGATAEDFAEPFVERKPDEPFTIFGDGADGEDVTKPTAEWVREHGRGFFASAEW